MKIINMYFLCGNMVTGKTSLVELIKQQNESFDGFVVLGEQNFYKNFLNNKKDKKKQNFHFEVQVFLLNNFLSSLKKIVSNFLRSDQIEIDIVTDTFPLITGYIFSSLKFKYGLITEDQYLLLSEKYVMVMGEIKLLFLSLRKNGVELKLTTFFRIVDVNISLAMLKKRNLKEYNFYIKNLDYYKELNENLADDLKYNILLFKIFDANVFNINFVRQKIEKKEDFNLYNRQVFQTIYKV